MKARTKKTRWLLITLLFGLLAAAGLTLTLRHGAWNFAKANGGAAPPHPAVQQPHTALLAATGAKHVFTAPAGAGRRWVVYSPYSNSQAPVAPGHSDSQPNTASSAGAAWSGHSSTSESIGGTQPQVNHPVTSNTGHLPPNGASELAYNDYAPLDCELPAGCGATAGGTEYVSRQPSGTSGTVPSLRNSNDGASPPPSDPQPKIIPAPELDPATLAVAATLLLGSLAVLRRRRPARASR